MKNLLFILIIFLAGQDSFALSSQDREIKIYKNIRCLVCQGQSLNDSNSDFANDLKKIIKNKIIEHQEDAQIYQYLADRYGDWILFNPPVKKNTIFLWLIPLLIVPIGGYFVYKKTSFRSFKDDLSSKNKHN